MTRSTRFTCFCTAQTSIFQKNFVNFFRIFGKNLQKLASGLVQPFQPQKTLENPPSSKPVARSARTRARRRLRVPPGTTVPPEEARSQRRGLRSLVGSCGRVGPPVQVGQRTRSECRGVLTVVRRAVRATIGLCLGSQASAARARTIRCLSDPVSEVRPRKTRATNATTVTNATTATTAW